MKTVQSSKFKVQSWPYKVILLLAIFNFQWSIVNSVKAQQENAAFYIYQNDGHFDGFFYDEVLKISYSVLDTLGIEHDEIVSQEIVTADSTYRIMLTAIDSVSFVQPEIKLNPKLVDIKKTGLDQYVISHGTEDNGACEVTLHLPKSQEGLIPKVGDILVDFYEDYGGHVKNMYVGKAVDSDDTEVILWLDPISSFSDIFEQFTTVEQYGADSQGNLVRRRIAGMPEMTIGEFPTKSVRRADSSLDFDFFNFSLSRHIPLFTDPTENWNISIDINTEIAMNAKAVWNFTDRKYMGLTIKVNPSLSLGFTVDYKFKDIFPAGFSDATCIYIPGGVPVFQINLSPDAFLRGECHANFNMQTPKLQGQFWIRLEADFSKDNVWDIWGLDFGLGTPPGEKDDPLAEAESNNWSAAMEFNGFVQTGIQQKFAFGTGKLLSWLINSSVEATTYIGPKLSGALNFSLSNSLEDRLSAYNLLKDSKLAFSPIAVDYESKAKVKSLFGGTQEITLIDGSLKLPCLGVTDVELYLFPDFEMDVEEGRTEDGKYKTATVTVKPSRNVLWPVNFGAGVFKPDGSPLTTKLGQELGMSNYGIFETFWPKDSVFTYTFDRIPTTGMYEIRPMFWMAGIGVEVYASPSYSIDGLYFTPKNELPPFVFDMANLQPVYVPAETNALRFKTKTYYETDHRYIKADLSGNAVAVNVDADALTPSERHRGSDAGSANFMLYAYNNERDSLKCFHSEGLVIGDQEWENIQLYLPEIYNPLSLPITQRSVIDSQDDGQQNLILSRTCEAKAEGSKTESNEEQTVTTSWNVSYTERTDYLKNSYKSESTPEVCNAYVRRVTSYENGGPTRFSYKDYSTNKRFNTLIMEYEKPSIGNNNCTVKMTIEFKDGTTDVRTWENCPCGVYLSD